MRLDGVWYLLKAAQEVKFKLVASNQYQQI